MEDIKKVDDKRNREIESAILEKFHVGDFYISAKILKSDIRSFGEEHGFRASVQGQSIVCNRSHPVSSDMHHKKRKHINNMGCNCAWSIFFRV